MHTMKYIAFTSLFILLTACGTGNLPADSAHSSEKGGQQKVENEAIDFTIEQEEAFPPEVKTEVEKMIGSQEGDHKVVATGEQSYLIIALGERNTGGYSVEVEKIEQQGDTLHVYAKEKPPAKGAMRIQVISYPLTVVSVKGNYTENDVTFHVKYANNEDNSP